MSSKKHHSFPKDIQLQDLSTDLLFTVMLFMLGQRFKCCTSSWLLGPLKLRTTERHCSRSASGHYLLAGNYIPPLIAGTELPGK